MSNLRKFADRVHKKTGGNFFIDITYNPGRRSRTVNLDETCFARLRLQWFHQDVHMRVKNAGFYFKHQKDMLDEFGEPYGCDDKSADRALAKLLSSIAGKELLVTVNDRTYTIRVPKNIATKEA